MLSSESKVCGKMTYKFGDTPPSKRQIDPELAMLGTPKRYRVASKQRKADEAERKRNWLHKENLTLFNEMPALNSNGEYLEERTKMLEQFRKERTKEESDSNISIVFRKERTKEASDSNISIVCSLVPAKYAEEGAQELKELSKKIRTNTNIIISEEEAVKLWRMMYLTQDAEQFRKIFRSLVLQRFC